MKNLTKIIGLTTAMLLASVVGVKAQTSAIIVSNLPAISGGSTSNAVVLTNGGYYISEIDVAVGTASTGIAPIVTFYDTTNYTTLQYSSTNSYVVKSEFLTNIVSVLTNNADGQVFTNTYPGTYTLFTTNAGYTNMYPIISAFALSANTVQRRTGQHIAVVSGLSAQGNTSNATVTVFYSPTF